MDRLTNNVALISGAASGLGAEFARELAAEGASVVIGDVLDQEGQQLADDIGPAARFVHLDVRDYDQCREAVEATEQTFGRLDIFVNNAGVVRNAPIDEHSVEDWNLVININLTDSFCGIRSAAAALKASGRGSIINISSDAGLLRHGGITGYDASKFGLRGLTKSAALDLGRYNVRVNTVHPGDMAEIARLVVFLASDESSFSAGTEFIADGGDSVGVAQVAS